MQNQALQDMEVLKKILNNDIEFKDVDIETKKRLIVLCKKREQQIKLQIESYKKKLK